MFDQAMRDAGISLSLLEQPVVKSDIVEPASVRNRTGAPVDADGAVFTPEDAVRVIHNDAADVIDIKLERSGLLEAADIAAITRAARHDLIVGCMLESSVSIHTGAHFVLGISEFSHVDLDATRLLGSDVIDRESDPTTTPNGPGHGITPN